MNFLAAVAAFLASIWLAYYIFVTLDNFVLGLGCVALIGIGFMQLINTARGPNE